MARYLEKYGGFGSLKDWGPGARPCHSGDMGSALDHVDLLMIMVEQTALDSGRTDLAWLLTLQPDPPASIFLNHQMLPVGAQVFRPFGGSATGGEYTGLCKGVGHSDREENRADGEGKACPPHSSKGSRCHRRAGQRKRLPQAQGSERPKRMRPWSCASSEAFPDWRFPDGIHFLELGCRYSSAFSVSRRDLFTPPAMFPFLPHRLVPSADP